VDIKHFFASTSDISSDVFNFGLGAPFMQIKSRSYFYSFFLSFRCFLGIEEGVEDGDVKIIWVKRRIITCFWLKNEKKLKISYSLTRKLYNCSVNLTVV
jgi:hypothetical protein